MMVVVAVVVTVELTAAPKLFVAMTKNQDIPAGRPAIGTETVPGARSQGERANSRNVGEEEEFPSTWN